MPSPLPGMRAWAASDGGYNFVITHEDGSSLRANADRKAWVGYTASYKCFRGRKLPAVRIDGLWQSFEAAEQACKSSLRQMKQKS